MTLDENLNKIISSEEAKPKKKLGIFKTFIIGATIAASLACGRGIESKAEMKKIYDSNKMTIYVSKDASIVKLVRDVSILRDEEYVFKGPPLKSLFDLDDRDLTLIRYTDKRLGLLKNHTYKDRNHLVDNAILNIKQEQGRRYIRKNSDNMIKYMSR